MKLRKIFPKIEKNVKTKVVIKKTIIAKLNVFFKLRLLVIAVNIGISDIGSIATIAFKKFWKKKSCI